MQQKLRRYHDDPERAFWLWNDVWLNPRFRSWNIERYLPAITCPVLAIQGYDDEYGTMEQLTRLSRGVPHCQLLQLKECRHSPHRDQPEAVLRAVAAWALAPMTAENRPHEVRTSAKDSIKTDV
jgi:pimeloyl-ACP methyl ester carboxylesterase